MSKADQTPDGSGVASATADATAPATPKKKASRRGSTTKKTGARSGGRRSGSAGQGANAAGNGSGGGSNRVVIVGGLRSPFVKSNTDFKHLTALDLAKGVVGELVQRLNLPTDAIDRVICGQVVASPDAPNIAREVVLALGLPHTVDAFSVNRACATSTQAMISGVQAIMTGEAEVVIAGGADALSRPPITYSDNVVDALMDANSARDLLAKARPFLDLKPKDLLPKAPALRELSTGLTMGQSAEKMAQDNGISRHDQDALALASHQKAAAAWDEGVYADEVFRFAVPPQYRRVVSEDAMIRRDSSMERLAKLKPVFDRKYGTVTAGNSSPLTDGAAAVVLMREDKARALGYTPLAVVKSWGFAGVDPNWQLLMGPYFAAPLALDRAGVELGDMDLVDMHEAFAAQVLSNLQAFESKAWAEKHLGRSQALGEVDRDKLNVCGGSISLGHPLAATGARQALTMARALHRRGGGLCLITQCAAGGLGAAVVLEGA